MILPPVALCHDSASSPTPMLLDVATAIGADDGAAARTSISTDCRVRLQRPAACADTGARPADGNRRRRPRRCALRPWLQRPATCADTGARPADGNRRRRPRRCASRLLLPRRRASRAAAAVTGAWPADIRRRRRRRRHSHRAGRCDGVPPVAGRPALDSSYRGERGGVRPLDSSCGGRHGRTPPVGPPPQPARRRATSGRLQRAWLARLRASSGYGCTAATGVSVCHRWGETALALGRRDRVPPVSSAHLGACVRCC